MFYTPYNETPTTEGNSMKDANVKIAKATAKLVAGLSVSMIVNNVLKTYVPVDTKIQKIELIVGTFVLANMVTERAGEWTDKQVDAVANAIEAITVPNTEETDTE